MRYSREVLDGPKKRIAKKTRAFLAPLLFAAIPVCCGFVGYDQGISNEHHNDKVATTKAGNLIACKNFALKNGETRRLSLTDLTPAEEDDCGVPRTFRIDIQPNIDNVEVSPENMFVTLPSVSSLDRSITKLDSDARNFSEIPPLEEAGFLALVGLGLAFGAWISENQ